MLGLLGLEEPAVAWLDYALEQEPFYYGAHVMLGLVAQLQGDREGARDFLERSLELSGDATLPRLRMGQLAWDDGQRDDAERWLDEAASVPEAVIAQKSEWWGPRWALSAIASVRGDTEEALRWYEEAIGAGRRHARWDIMDPLFENIREDARFVALIDDLDERVQSMRPRAEDVPLPPR